MKPIPVTNSYSTYSSWLTRSGLVRVATVLALLASIWLAIYWAVLLP